MALNIEHVFITPYTPYQNAKIERLHKTLNDMIAKQVSQDNKLWDVFLNQTLSAIRVCKNESTGSSPYYLLFKREPILPLDNILQPRRRYMGENLHQITLEKMHREFTQVHSKMKKSQLRQQRYANKGAEEVKFKVGDPVFLRNFKKNNKLQGNWQPYYRVTAQTSPVTYTIRNQLDNTEIKAQGRNLKLANTDNWEIRPKGDRPIRRVTLAAPQETTSDSYSSTEDSDDDIPLAQLIKRKRIAFNSSESDEENIPLAELVKRIRARRDTNKVRTQPNGKEPPEDDLNRDVKTEKSDSSSSEPDTDSEMETAAIEQTKETPVTEKAPGINKEKIQSLLIAIANTL